MIHKSLGKLFYLPSDLNKSTHLQCQPPIHSALDVCLFVFLLGVPFLVDMYSEHPTFDICIGHQEQIQDKTAVSEGSTTNHLWVQFR